jgi:hypothetical protein
MKHAIAAWRARENDCYSIGEHDCHVMKKDHAARPTNTINMIGTHDPL